MSLRNKNIWLLSTGDSVGGAYELMHRMAKALSPHVQRLCLAVKQRNYTEPFIKNIPCYRGKKSFARRSVLWFQRKLNMQKPELGAIADREYVFYYQEEETQKFVTADQLLNYIGFVPDVVLVGLTTGFVNTAEIFYLWQRTNAIIIYVMLDVFPITGGCHVMRECGAYKNECVNCPAVKNTVLNNLPHMQYLSKKRYYDLMKPYFLGDSQFIRRILGDSSLPIKILPIPSCVPTDIFNNNCRLYAKKIWNIPEERFVVLVGADNVKDPRKGRKYVVDALLQLDKIDSSLKQRLLVLLVGNHNSADEETKKIPFLVKYVDYVRDMRLLSLLYQASDLYIMSSLEEAGPMMVPEAMLCGTLVVGFQTGFLEDETFIQSGVNGFRVPMANVDALAKTLQSVLALSSERLECILSNARQTALNKMSDNAFVEMFKKYMV